MQWETPRLTMLSPVADSESKLHFNTFENRDTIGPS